MRSAGAELPEESLAIIDYAQEDASYGDALIIEDAQGEDVVDGDMGGADVDPPDAKCFQGDLTIAAELAAEAGGEPEHAGVINRAKAWKSLSA